VIEEIVRRVLSEQKRKPAPDSGLLCPKGMQSLADTTTPLILAVMVRVATSARERMTES
jgi:hypothetical protein